MAMLRCGVRDDSRSGAPKERRQREISPRRADGARDILANVFQPRLAPLRSHRLMSERYFEDFAAGQVFKPSGRVRVEKDEIIAFAKTFDPQPFHLDEEAARRSIFGTLVASGWHTAALTMSLIARSEYRAAGGTVGLGFESLRWPIPVRPGDELRIESEVLETRPSKSRPDRGVLKMRTRTFNQNGEIVQEVVANGMVPRRPAGEKQ
jgi:acyl dehydratase